MAHPEKSAELDPDLPHFANTECPYFPCHEGIEPHLFNCLFCFCPLYALGEDCGGSPVFSENGVKDCSRCTLPHRGNAGNRLVNDKFAMLSASHGKHAEDYARTNAVNRAQHQEHACRR